MTTDLQDAHERLSLLPPLEDLFLDWSRSGRDSNASVANGHSLLLRREQVLGPMTLPATTIELLYDVATHCLSACAGQSTQMASLTRPLHARIIRHAPSLTAVQKQAYMPAGVVVQKTVSITLGETCLLWTGAGSYHLTRRQLRQVGRVLGLSSNTARHAVINPVSVDPIEHFGMQPGMVSSFLQPGATANVAAIVLLPVPPRSPRHEGDEPAEEIAISLSLWESLLLPLHCFPHLVKTYCSSACPTIPCISL